MKVLIACEFSGVVRDAFAAKGHDAISCDLLPSDRPGNHYMGDVANILNDGYDLMIGHPPCTYLARSGEVWMKRRPERLPLRQLAVDFFMLLYNAPIEKIAIENPIGIMSRVFRKPDQIIQPWQFGHGETKATCFWLKNLPRLQASDVVDGRDNRVHMMGQTKDRWKKRSLTYEGVAKAMADQWGTA